MSEFSKIALIGIVVLGHKVEFCEDVFHEYGQVLGNCDCV